MVLFEIIKSVHGDGGVEACERLTPLGTDVNLVIHSTGTMHLGNATSANAIVRVGVDACERLTPLGTDVNLVIHSTGTMHLGNATSANTVYGETVQIGNLQDGANIDFGGVVWWQGLSDTFILLIPILCAALPLKFESLFVTHQTNIWIFIIATCIYVYTFTVTKKATHHKTTSIKVTNHIAIFSGALSTASTFSILLSFKHALIFFVIWSLAFAFFTLKLIYCHFNLHTNNWTKSLCDKFNKLWSYFVKSFRDKFNKLRGGGDTDIDTTLSPQRTQLPV